MRIANYLVIAGTALVLSLSANAQNAQQSTNLVAANAVLQTRIDAKTAKAGDTVVVKLASSIRVPGGTELPRNTLLIGHIDQAQAAEHNGVSTVTLTFDKAQPKHGQAVAIKTTIIGIQPSGTEFFPPDLNSRLKVEQAPDSAHGFSLNSDVQGANSGVLKADGKNVRVGDGTELQLAVAPITTGATATGN